jgi:hypothetical protein
MKIFKQSQRIKPKVSLILLDWSVRESFHLLHYLSLQTIPREQFEVVIVEYYSRHSEAIQKFEEQVDTWIALEMPEDLYYHKHLMYNAGIVASTGEICIICDSDAMAKPTFLETVIKSFEYDPDIILHIDQFRNNRKDLYPFCYPSFEEVTGPGCINIKDGKTTGLAVTEDLIHNRNYGACFCAKREDLIKIGGADEHIDFIGHICGPYDFTFRLMNLGKKEVWHDSEFLYHTWHPGQAGENNYLGPHDGRHVSTTSLEALTSNRVQPHVMNKAIAKLQKDSHLNLLDVENDLILSDYNKIAKMSFLMSPESRKWAEKTYAYLYYKGYYIFPKDNEFIAIQGYTYQKTFLNNEFDNLAYVKASSIELLKQKIDENFNIRLNLSSKFILFYFNYLSVRRLAGKVKQRILKVIDPVIQFISDKMHKIYRIISHPSRKFKDLKSESNYLKEDIFSLASNIFYFLKQKPDERVVLLVTNKLEYNIMNLLVNIKLMPKISVLLLNDIDSVKLSDAKVFSSRTTYIQNLDLFLNHEIKPVIV